MVQNPLLNNRYRLIEEEGSGGMAVVYKAQDLELDRVVALKVLKPDLTKDPEFLMRFREEARAAANLTHPNIVTVYDYGQDGRSHYIVLEHVEGHNLKEFILDQAPLDVESSLLIMIELCKGLGYAHRAGFVHCDVKPQNVLVTPDRRIKITDFGLARALTASYPNEVQEVVWGSPSYLSPERIAGEAPTPPSDVYALGIVLFELLSGRLPFSGATYREIATAHLQQAPPSLNQLNPMVPLELEQIVRKVLSKEPTQRYRTADQLGRILLKYQQQGEEATAAFPVTPSRPGRTPPPPADSPEPQPPPDPVMPPLDLERYASRETLPHASRPVPSAASAPVEPPDAELDDEDIIVIDLYAVALGLLAGAAILGLIPLWVSVFSTFR